VIEIRKYPNRRLYDTSRSTYVNLEELAELVRAGHEVRVVDAKSGEDLTRDVLLQVVLEVMHGVDLLPVGMLRRMIRASGSSPAHLLLRRQLTTGMELMSAQLDRMEALLQPPPAPPPPPPVRAPAPGDEPAAATGSGDGELDELRRRLAELERRLSRS
jgi:polyhydroxyalkanoate synthesis repressor PhaR